MKRMLFGAILLPFLLGGVVACGKSNVIEALNPSYKSEADCGFVQNVYGERISWKGKLPIQLALHESVPTEMVSAFTSAIQHWEQATGKPLFQLAGSPRTGPLSPRQDGVNLIYWMDTWEQNRSSEQARTSVYWVGDEIREADIRINAKDFTYYLSQPQSLRDVHLQSLVVHELGHVLGLKHKDSGGSVMATYLAAATDRTEITATDLNSIQCEY